jgi:hypothetical protein
MSTTNISNAPGTPAVIPSVIKRRAGGQESVKAFSLENESVQNRDIASPVVKQSGEQVISEEEKQYFETLFPAAADAVRTYSPYQRNGLPKAGGIGTLVDVKG